MTRIIHGEIVQNPGIIENDIKKTRIQGAIIKVSTIY